ncbi:unnamed protein product [Cyprideis torosa]|uniref:RING-type E3 ubiquitin transferase n=1 Tax=Cyprideis torosa TaxID=163714 RepID=A0A7R8W3U7_9CRUS|nr:unnamed protein product [Cyprideis torosa]CAG0878948.1 unnamed protein product [Cyprideis torosa]
MNLPMDIFKLQSTLLALISVGLSAAVIGNAYYQKKQFYPAVVYITKSNPCMAVMYLQGFVSMILLSKLLRKIFFGQLRPAEFEHLLERSWYAVTETCLAFTVFRDDFSPKFVALFTLLLFLKSFHWLAEDRVDYMERSPVITWRFHLRLSSLLLLLGTLDFMFVRNAYYSTIAKGPSVQLVFGFEYAILATATFNMVLKYLLHTVDVASENPWESKAVFLLHAELMMGFIKVVLYATFMVIMVRIHTFPLFAIRPMYLTTRAFKKALHDVVMSRRAIRNMNTLYPDATPEELAQGDSTCIICREEMTAGAKKLPCGHIFHAACLRSWFQRQQTCPTCRMDILRTPMPNTTPAGAAPIPVPVAPQTSQPGAAAGAVPAQDSTGGAPQTQIPPPLGGGLPLPQFPPVGGFAFLPPFPPVPFLPPPPLPPPDFAGLTLDELREMEGHERSAVEARIRCLRNIQTLLDAAALQMAQYQSLAAAERGQHRVKKEDPVTSELFGATPPEQTQPSSSENREPTTPPSNGRTSSSNTTEDEIRQRRLQRFTAANNQN